MDHAFEATCCRTALLLGLVTGHAVRRWAQRVIEHEPEPAAALLDLASLPSTDLTGLRHALWPLVVDPEPDGAMTVLFRHELIDAGRRLRLVEEVRGSGHDQDNVWIYDRIPTAVQ